MNEAEQAAKQHANLQHARAIAALHEDDQPTPHDQLSRTQRYVMVSRKEAVCVRIITVMNELYYVPPSGFPFKVSSAPQAQFFPIAKAHAATEKEAQYRIELVWNREFDWFPYGPRLVQLDDCITVADDLLNQGDGERVKKCRIVNDDGVVVWEDGRLVKQTAKK